MLGIGVEDRSHLKNLATCAEVLRQGKPAWLVIAGSDICTGAGIVLSASAGIVSADQQHSVDTFDLRSVGAVCKSASVVGHTGATPVLMIGSQASARWSTTLPAINTPRAPAISLSNARPSAS